MRIFRIWPPALLTKSSFTGVSQRRKLYVTQLSSNLHSNYFSEQFQMAASLCISYISSQKENTANNACSRSTIQKLHKLWNVCKVYRRNLTSETIFRIWKHFKKDEKCFFFYTLKAFFVLKMFKFLSGLFGHVGKRLD